MTFPKNKIQMCNRIEQNIFQPVIFDERKTTDKIKFEQLIRNNKLLHVIDTINDQLIELNDIFELRRKTFRYKSKTYKGHWIFYPWQRCIIHTLRQNDFKIVRLSRNKNLIFDREQKLFHSMRIGIAGLNVGGSAAMCLASAGGTAIMKFAENDCLSLSNLNRFNGSIADIGLNKAILIARKIFEMDPFYNITLFTQGIQTDNVKKFLLQPRVGVVVEEMDNLPLKLLIRKLSKKNHIPVIMVTGNAENVILDIERYDQEPDIPILNGLLAKNVEQKILRKPFPLKEKIFLCRDFIGKEYLDSRLLESFKQVGTQLVGIPQLAESTFLRGAIISYVIRQIAIHAPMPSGRFHIKLHPFIP